MNKLSTDTILSSVDLDALAAEMGAHGDHDAAAFARDAAYGNETSRDAIAAMYRRGDLTHPSEVVQALFGLERGANSQVRVRVEGEDCDAGHANISLDGEILVSLPNGYRQVTEVGQLSLVTAY